MPDFCSVCAGSVALFDVNDTVSDEAIVGQLSNLFGPVVAVKRNAQVAGCREVFFSDVRSAQKAIAHFSKRPTTIDEVYLARLLVLIISEPGLLL